MSWTLLKNVSLGTVFNLLGKNPQWSICFCISFEESGKLNRFEHVVRSIKTVSNIRIFQSFGSFYDIEFWCSFYLPYQTESIIKKQINSPGVMFKTSWDVEGIFFSKMYMQPYIYYYRFFFIVLKASIELWIELYKFL